MIDLAENYDAGCFNWRGATGDIGTMFQTPLQWTLDLDEGNERELIVHLIG